MRRAAVLLLLLIGPFLVAVGPLATPAYASGCLGTGGYGHHFGGGGVSVNGATCTSGSSGGSDSPGPVAPVYEHAYTPSCPGNGPPGPDQRGGVNLCRAATDTCPDQEDLREFSYRRQVPGGRWEQVGVVCRGANEPLRVPPQVTADMVGAAAFAAAPTPRAMVEPNRTSYVGVPNNYYADAPDTDPTIVVLGHPIQLHFTVSEVTWHFGDGQTQVGNGVRGAAIAQAGAVEHAYAKGALYSITATTSVGVRFTLPDGLQVDQPDVFARTSEPVTLPVVEIQALVDQVG